MADLTDERLADLAPEGMARRFHEAYERLAPSFGYETRRDSAVPWDDVPETNRRLMIAVAAAVVSPAFDELLAEVERLRGELADFERGANAITDGAKALYDEIDRLRAELAVAKPDGWESTAVLQEAYGRTETDLLAAQEERDAARAELAKARENLDAADQYIRARNELGDQIQAAVVKQAEELAAARNALADCVVKATEYGTQDGEFVAMYLLPTGPIHRAIPMLDAVGINVRPGFDGRKGVPAPSAVETPAPDQIPVRVWIATARRDIDYHLLTDDCKWTLCGRSTRTGRLIVNRDDVIEQYQARPCPRCDPVPDTGGMADQTEED